MTYIRSAIRWASLYILVLIALGAIYWFETMQISQYAQDFLSSLALIATGILINHWIKRHESYFLAFGFEGQQNGQDRWDHRSLKDRIAEEK